MVKWLKQAAKRQTVEKACRWFPMPAPWHGAASFHCPSWEAIKVSLSSCKQKGGTYTNRGLAITSLQMFDKIKKKPLSPWQLRNNGSLITFKHSKVHFQCKTFKKLQVIFVTLLYRRYMFCKCVHVRILSLIHWRSPLHRQANRLGLGSVSRSIDKQPG